MSGAGETGPDGVTGGYTGGSITITILIGVFGSLTIYNALELWLLIFITFTRWKGLYFWSLLISSAGLVPYALGFMFKFYFVLTGNAKWVAVTLLTIGWWAMVTGSSVVLWSRLHLILTGDQGVQVLRYTKWMIIVDALVLHLSTTVVTYGSNGSIDTQGFIRAYNVIEKVQMTGFFLQEIILSSVYIGATYRILKTSLRHETRNLMNQLLVINVAIIAMDAALLGIEYANLFVLETMIKGLTYSIKLKLEFAILSRLVQFVGGDMIGARDTRAGSRARAMTFADEEKDGLDGQGTNLDPLDISEFVDLDRVDTDYTHASPGFQSTHPRLDEEILTGSEDWGTDDDRTAQTQGLPVNRLSSVEERSPAV